MDLQIIQNQIRALTPGGDYDFSASAFGNLACIAPTLQTFFGVPSLSLHGLEPEAGQLRFRGVADGLTYLDHPCTQVPVTVQFSGGDGWLCLELGLPVNGAWEPFAHLSQRFGLHAESLSCTGRFWDRDEVAVFEYQVSLTLGDVAVDAVLSPLWGNRWNLSAGAPGANVVLPALTLDHLLDLSGQGAVLQWLPPDLTALLAETACTCLNLTVDCSPDAKNPFDAFQGEVRLGDGLGVWTPAPGLSLRASALGVTVRPAPAWDLEHTAPSVDVQVSGVLDLGGQSVPVTVSIADNGKQLTALLGGDTPLTNLASLAGITGQSLRMEDFLPAGYDAGSLSLRSLLLQVGGGSPAFALDVSLSARWTFFDWLQVEELRFAYQYDGSGSRFLFSGILQFAGVPFDLTLQGGDQLELAGFTLSEDGVSLKTVLEQVTGVDLPVPDFVLDGLYFHCIPAQERYELAAGVSLRPESDGGLGFTRLQADCSITVTKTGGGWDHTLELSGTAELFHSLFQLHYELNPDANAISLDWLPDETFTLSHLLDALGLEGAAVLDQWDLSLHSVHLDYGVAGGVFTGSLDTSLGRASLHSAPVPDSDRRATVLLLEAADPIRLSDLPFVGSCLPDMADASLDPIGAAASTIPLDHFALDGSDLTMETGLALYCRLVLPGDGQTLMLPLVKTKGPRTGSGGDGGASLSYPLDKTLGPLLLRNLLLRYEPPVLSFGLDMGLTAGLLSLSLDGLRAGLNLSDRSMSAGLDGLGVRVDAQGLTVGGSLLREAPDTYAGTLTASLSAFTIRAVGSYTAGALSSLFAFGVLRGRLGGPPCFQVTGIGLGFGYQRALPVPPVAELEQFPLLLALGDGANLDQIRQEADALFSPTPGALWLAAGLTATSFGMADIRALLTLYLSPPLEVHLLGRGEVNFPNGVTHPMAHAVLLLDAAIRPDRGVASMEGMLSDDSYVLSPNAHLTGGFACCLWFAGPHKGDFVVSFGGYDRNYRRPDHYPNPQRLGLVWQEGSTLSIRGEAYFALIPACLMAGGGLHLDFSLGPIHAWLDADVRIQIGWKPVYYEFAVSVLVGVRVKLWLLKLSLELGCALDLWGPDLSGRATIHLSFLHFTISLGSTPKGKAEPLTPAQFAQSFLPAAEPPRLGTPDNGGLYASGSLQWLGGVLGERTVDGQTQTVAAAHALALCFRGAVPFRTYEFVQDGGPSQQGAVPGSLPPPVLRPCGGRTLETAHLRLLLRRTDGKPVVGRFALTLQTEQLPAALWAAANYDGETVEQATSVTVTVEPSEGCTVTTFVGHLFLGNTASLPPVPPLRETKLLEKKEATIALNALTNPATHRRRLAFLEQVGLSDAPMDLTGLESPLDVFLNPPQVWESQPQEVLP